MERPVRVGVICDLVEEHWPSMDLVADRLLHHLERDFAGQVHAERLCPPLRPRLGWRPCRRTTGLAPTADRLLNRVWDYPRWLRREIADGRFDLFHIVDHSYAHLVHSLPGDKTVVTCHDLDAFRAVLAPGEDPRSWPFRAMAGRTLGGLRKARCVGCDSDATRDELLRYNVIPADRAVVARLGVHPSRSAAADPRVDAEVAAMLGPDGSDATCILHVGSTIPRKRIDLLLRILARVRNGEPGVQLLRVGGPLTAEQTALAGTLGVADAIRSLPFLSQELLSAVYRRAALLVLPSDREGFGLPVVEALACGTPVVASDLPVLHEVGGTATGYAAHGDLDGWTDLVVRRLRERRARPDAWERRRQAGLAFSASFSWAGWVATMVTLYGRVLGGQPVAS